jgi:hypothetical protein
MDECKCSIATNAELKALLASGESETKEQTLAYVEALLTSRDAKMRAAPLCEGACSARASTIARWSAASLIRC